MASEVRNLLVKVGAGVGITFTLLFLAGAAAGYLTASGAVTLSPMGPWVIALLAVAAVALMAVALWIGTVWMRSIDEAAQEAHKWSWYWGGSAGLGVVGVGVVMAVAPQFEQIQFAVAGRTDPVAYMALGAFGSMMILTTGYAMAWAWWWFSRSRS